MFESDFMNISSISIWDITQLLVEMVISVSATTIDWSSVMKEYFSCLDWLEWRIVWNTWLIVFWKIISQKFNLVTIYDKKGFQENQLFWVSEYHEWNHWVWNDD